MISYTKYIEQTSKKIKKNKKNKKCIYIIQYTADIIQYCNLVRCQVIYNTVKFIFG